MSSSMPLTIASIRSAGEVACTSGRDRIRFGAEETACIQVVGPANRLYAHVRASLAHPPRRATAERSPAQLLATSGLRLLPLE